MKKFLLIIGIAAAILIFSACEHQPKAPDIVTAADRNISVVYGGKNYDCHMNYVSPATASVSMNTPENIQGLTLRRSDGTYALSLGGLICRTDQSILPDQSVLMKTIQTFDLLGKNIGTQNITLKSSSDKKYEFILNTPGQTAVITTNEKGNITKIQIP
ncbi:MAG: hypothetical protein II711_01290 [Clostridia bacterium]|nr:hypothetical protein [Clostridia bacterium]